MPFVVKGLAANPPIAQLRVYHPDQWVQRADAFAVVVGMLRLRNDVRVAHLNAALSMTWVVIGGRSRLAQGGISKFFQA